MSSFRTGLKSGEITGTHLMQQLGNPGLQSRHREMLLTILRLHHHQRQVLALQLCSTTRGCGAGTTVYY